jgi:phenylpropionate dioxygenase-like ring-hydroxylating dioxygenase large terminal subunit
MMEFLRNAWYVAMWSQDLKPGELVGRTYLNEPVVLFRQADGSVSALEDACPHRMAPLSMGKLVKGGNLRCAYHGLEFNADGRCVHNPHASGRIPKAAQVRAYPVVERHSLVWIWMGDRQADPAVIPDFSLLEGPDPVSKRDWMKMEANYQFVVDNLLDLSHTAFLHEGILGSKETIKADLRLEEKENKVIITRLMPNVPPPKFHDILFMRDGKNVDYWSNIHWHLPGCLINDTGISRPGAPKSEGTGIYGTHFLTPETETSTWYHFAGVRQNPISWGEPIDSENMKQIADLRRYAFEVQDKGIIEGQQRIIRQRRKPVKFMPLETDLGTVRVWKIMESRIKEERQALQKEGVEA